MIVLALDSSGPTAGVALMQDDRLVYEATLNNGLTHSVNLMPMVEEAIEKSGFPLPDIDCYAAVAGPGSFTGVRIGVAAVKAMAQAQQKPCIGVNALEALAYGLAEEGDIICPIRDARVQQVYGAAFSGGSRVMEDVALKLSQYVAQIDPLGQRFLFVGDGVEPSRQQLVALLGNRARFAPPHLNMLKAGAAAAIALRDAHRAVKPEQLVPLYLRKSQAERERQAHGHG
ncbi:MAG: tRNA (adenosine(37)-N6)-threonylcarbamoyltransferase complex dimerization subunit type 1 TsaB [Clostridiales bacterium]|nr:tRNA (adenosine(37)-N6)-threonylcarbamoyltransferase complex dimerization subunit type 1 TsaB [Clostridiales bacterium]